MSLSTCTSCGETAVTEAGVCKCCGTSNHKKADKFSRGVAFAGLILYAPLLLAAHLLTYALHWDGVRQALALVIAHLVPVSFLADAIFIARKRRHTAHTGLALFIGIIGIAEAIQINFIQNIIHGVQNCLCRSHFYACTP